MDARYYNGEPDAQHDPGTADGRPERFRCLECSWRGNGYGERGIHHTQTGHRIVWIGDPRPSPSTAKVA